MHSLPLFVKIAGQPVILLGEGEAAQAKRRLIERAGGLVVDEDDARAAAARIAFVALDDPDEAATRLKARGLLVNVVDRPALCDFTTPAIVDREPVLVAIATGGASAGLAAALRQRLEALLPARLGALADALREARLAMKARWPDGGARRRALGTALQAGGALDPLGDDGDVAGWLAAGDAPEAAQTVMLCLGSADPDDLTVRAARLLGQADRIVHPADAPPAILNLARADAVRIPAGSADDRDGLPGLTVRIGAGQ